jgi:hypothetical protein
MQKELADLLVGLTIITKHSLLYMEYFGTRFCPNSSSTNQIQPKHWLALHYSWEYSFVVIHSIRNINLVLSNVCLVAHHISPEAIAEAGSIYLPDGQVTGQVASRWQGRLRSLCTKKETKIDFAGHIPSKRDVMCENLEKR